MSPLRESPVVRAEHLTRRYGTDRAVEDATFAIEPNSITGLVGRNGAGKSTLLRLIAGQEFATGGRIEVFGAAPAENPTVAHRSVLVREDQIYPNIRVRHAIAAASWCYPQWDPELAATLIEEFGLPIGRRVRSLSRGMRSALGIVIGLACRAELTLLDEPYAGLDPVARALFYDRLLVDYAEHPRTILLSTHLVDEIAGLLERVLLIDRGRIALDAPADEVRGSAVTVSGPREAVARFTSGRIVWDAGGLGAHARATVAAPVTEADRALARRDGLVVEPVTLQQLLVRGAGVVTGPDSAVRQEVRA